MFACNSAKLNSPVAGTKVSFPNALVSFRTIVKLVPHCRVHMILYRYSVGTPSLQLNLTKIKWCRKLRLKANLPSCPGNFAMDVVLPQSEKKLKTNLQVRQKLSSPRELQDLEQIIMQRLKGSLVACDVGVWYLQLLQKPYVENARRVTETTSQRVQMCGWN